MRSSPIAIVGRACVLPGALSPEALWRTVAEGRDRVSAVDPKAWRVDPGEVLCDARKTTDSRDRCWSDRGGYVRGFETVWDPRGFCVAPEELEGLDPLVHWLLHCAREALADAGDERRGAVERARVGAVFGNLGYPTAEMTRYAEAVWCHDSPLAEPLPVDPRNRFMSAGAAELLERALGLAPGVFCLDTACASSLYAIKLACDRLHDGEADMMLAGAVNRADDLFLHVGFTALSALSRSGRSRPFHAEADGLLPAEGAGFVALQRLDDARREGRRIYGIIRGVGLSNDGRGRGFLAPAEAGQVRALRQAYDKAGVDPREVSLLECHATGTTVGDATELRSSARVFEGAQAPLPIGSLKSNLGHAVTAAGIAGLIKVLEAMRHGQRPPSLHADSLTPALESTPFRVLRELEDWPREGRPRVAGISAFGFGGNNAHLVVSEDDPELAAGKPASLAADALAIVGLGVIAGEALDVDQLEGLLLGSGSSRRTGAFEVELAGLRFPPNDLRRALGQQLLALAAAREATDDQSLDQSLVRETSGVFVGIEPDPDVCRHGLRWRMPPRARAAGVELGDWLDAVAPPLEAADVIGKMPNIPANRINAQLDLGGPSWTVFAGESSGRCALDLAARALRSRELDVALVGAVDLSAHPVHELAMRSREGGDSKREPESEQAGDAASVLVLRRLGDARALGLPLLGVLEPGGPVKPEPALRLEPGGHDFGLRARLGRCFAAGDLRDLCAAIVTGRRGLLPDGQPWPRGAALSLAPRSGGEHHALRPVPARPSLVGFAAADEAGLDAALARGQVGGAGPCRAVLLANGPPQLGERVARARACLRGECPAGPGVHLRRRPVEGQLALVFNGAGAAYPGMGRDLLAALPELGESIRERSPELAAAYEAPWGEEAQVPPLQRLWAASFVCQIHARLSLELLGLRPQAIIGYSSGESNSLFATGIWSDHDAMIRACRDSGVFTREIGGELQAVARAWQDQKAAPAWETWTVLAPIPTIEAALAGESRAHLSVIHHDAEAIVAGDPQACARIRERLGAARWIRLHYDLAVHTPELAEIREQWLELHRWPVTPRPDLRVYSGSREGRSYAPSTEACARAILGQAEERLDFRKVIEQAYADGVRVFVEHGPRAACSRWIREILGDREAVVVSLDRKGAGVEAVIEAVAALSAASVPCHADELLARLARADRPRRPRGGPTLRLEARQPPVPPPPRVERAPAQDAPMQSMPPAPELPPVDAIAPRLTAAAGATPAPTGAPAAAPVPARSENPLAAAIQAQLTELGRRQREFIAQQRGLHEQFLALHERSVAMLSGAASGSTSAPTRAFTPRALRTPPPRPAPLVAPTPSLPEPAEPAEPALLEPSQTQAPETKPGPTGLTFDRAALEIHAGGRISDIFGPAFAGQDHFHRQVRMPEPPLLLADRVTGLDAEPMSMKLGTIWTETDVTADAWYLHAGRMPAGIMIESGQADLMLISYLGVDAENKGERVYRLLGCTLTYHGNLPEVGDTLAYDIHLDGHAKQGGIRLMFFHYDCHVDGQLRLSVRAGQAGFFTDAELADSDGCLWTPEGQEIVPAEHARLDPPDLACERESFTPEQVAAFAAGRPWDCFGPGFEAAKPHTRTPRVQSGKMHFFDGVDRLELRGGPWGRGYLRASAAVHPEDWFFAGHFLNDPCMPGTLMFEGCLQAMAFFMAGCGFTLARDGWRFEPVPGEATTLSCRGQVTPRSRQVSYEVFVEEIIAGPHPTLYADLLCTVDGLKAFHARRFGLRLVPAWPLDEGHVLLENYTEPAPEALARSGDFAFGFRSMLACAQGRPSEAFGPIYRRFDSHETVARLPNPPYHFITRALAVEGEMGGMKPGARVEVEYEVPPDAWYFAENGGRTMPFAVLLEAALQPCGWLASYIGCALSSKESLMFRNLDGTGTLHAEVLPQSGTLRTRVKNVQLSRLAAMIIVGFEVECRIDATPIYSLDTVFGFFPAAAFEDQAGLPTSEEQRAALRDPGERSWELDGGRSTPGRARMARPMLLMIDRVTLFEPEGGAAGLGRARAEKRVDPGEWFFAAHFFQDPVQPGSLGIEAMIQLLQWTMLELGMDAGMSAPRFEPLALGRSMTWKYRGQVVPSNELISTTLEIRERGQDERGAYAIASASLWVDGKRIYEAPDLAVRIVDEDIGEGRVRVLDPARDPWIADHCPTWTVPALPMMSMVDLLAGAARADERLIGLRDVRVRGWVVVDRPIAIRCERDRDRVRLLIDEETGEREIASARLLTGAYGPAPAPLDALTGDPVSLPYKDGSLFHGPAFHLLESLVRTRAGASSRVRARGEMPLGRLNPGLLDATTHGIPHDRLDTWDWPQPPTPGKVAYPAWIPELDLFGPTPTEGTLRCEVRPAGTVGSPDFPAFEIQLIGDRGVWCRLRLVEACFAKGSLGSAEPAARRAFLRDHRFVPGLSVSTLGARDSRSRLDPAELDALDWLPGTLEGIYGIRDPAAILRSEHIAAAHHLHPRFVERQLPLTRFELELDQPEPGGVIELRGEGFGRQDLQPLRDFWTPWFDRGPWPVEDIHYGLIARFVRRVVVADPPAFEAVAGRSVLFLANHQVAVESLLFSVIASGLLELPTVTLAKAEHRHTWLGDLIQLSFSYPQIRDPGLITFFDRADKAALMGIIAELGEELRNDTRSVMVHIEGTRSLTCRRPVEKMSGAFLDMAIAVNAPVVPVRFVGGLPVDPLAERIEFPVGMGQQDIYFGRPLLPEELAQLPYGERKAKLITAINGLGPSNADEQPLGPRPGDTDFSARVEAWQAARGVSQPHAVLREVLAEIPEPTEATCRLLRARSVSELAGDESAEGRWLLELGRRVLGE